MLKIKCILLDDELPGLTYLRMLCEQFPFIEVVKCFDSPLNVIEEFKTLEFDLCLLDINMPGLSGLEVAQVLKDKYIIFVSAHPEYAADAYDLEAIDFIKKPVAKERLEKALNKAYKLITEKESRKTYFSWNTNQGKSMLFFDELLYINTSEIDKRDKLAYLKDDQTLLLKNISIEKLLSLLPSGEFIQVNKAEIVSKKTIQSHAADEITLKIKHPSKKQFVVTLGDSFRKNFQDWLRFY
ncbi:MAG: two-component system response regulator [Bacteroidetes bacterium]|nr:two-component system response regulator [Bacteroidota bacterium]